MALVAVEPTKVCAACKTRKPWSQFYPKVKWPDGTTRQPHSRCKDCFREVVRKWQAAKRAADPEWQRGRARRQHAALRADPERWAAELARRREWKRKRHGCKHVKSRYDKPVARGSGGPALDPAPFAAWLNTLGTNAEAIGRVVGMDAAQVRKYLKCARAVTLDVVDRALIEAATVTTLDDLYPIEETV